MLALIMVLAVSFIACICAFVVASVPSFIAPDRKLPQSVAVAQAVAGYGILVCVAGLITSVVVLTVG